MIEFSRIPDKLTISSIFEYTYRYVETRFEYSDRDILPSRLKITQRKRYRKNKEGKFNTPDELIFISSTSAPQYQPYVKNKSKNAKRQMKVKHTYDIRIAIQPTSEGYYSYKNSKMIWRTGSFKKPKKAPQKDVKTIYTETRNKLEHKYRKLNETDKRKAINKDIEKIKKNAKYLNNGDYNAQVHGVMLDCYYRDYFVQNKFGCLYGVCNYYEPYKGIDLPFADKHLIAVITMLIRKGIIKLY